MTDVVDDVGELLFGRRLRLRVLLWAAAQPEPFHQSQAARGVDYSSSGEVAKELERLHELGMLRKFGRSNRRGPQRYVRIEHPGWAIAEATARAVAAPGWERGADEETDVGVVTRLGGPGTAVPRHRHDDGSPAR